MDQLMIAIIALLIFGAGVFGYWIRGEENDSARQPDDTEHGVGRTL